MHEKPYWLLSFGQPHETPAGRAPVRLKREARGEGRLTIADDRAAVAPLSAGEGPGVRLVGPHRLHDCFWSTTQRQRCRERLRK